MFTGINESKTLTEHLYQVNTNVNLIEENMIQIKIRITINIDVSAKNINMCEKDFIWNPAACSRKNGKYFANIIGDLVITCDEIIEETKKAQKNSNEKKKPVKQKLSVLCLPFFLIPTVLLIDVSYYCYLIKFKSKQEHLLPFYVTNNELKEVLYC